MVRRFPLSVLVLTGVFLFVVILFVLAPLLVVIVTSFSESQFIAFPPESFSLRWYERVFETSRYIDAGWLSLRLAVLVTISSVFIGGLAAIAIHRRLLAWSEALQFVFLSPLILPTIIFAIGMLLTWSTLVGRVSLTTLWLAHTVIAIPYVLRTTLAVLADSDPFLEEAARTMGAGRIQRLVYVTIPQCVPGLLAGGFFAFNISFDEAVLSLFLRTPELTTLPIQIYGQLEFSPNPSIAAVSTLMIGLTIVLMLVIDRILGIGRFARS